MFRLNSPLPHSIAVAGFSFDVDLAFDNVLDVLDVLRGDGDDAQKLIAALALFIGPLPDWLIEPTDQYAVLQGIMQAYVIPAPPKPKTDLNGDPMPEHEDDTPPVVDYTQDAEYIWTGFVQAYGIDLTEQRGQLDWRKFQALLRDLPDDTKLKQIIRIRTWKPEKGTSGQARRQMRELQDEFALDEVDEE